MKLSKRALRNIIAKNLLNEETYTVKPGDTMYDIAQAQGVGIADLLAANPQFDAAQLKNWKQGDSPGEGDYLGASGRNPNWIYPGDGLNLPEKKGGKTPSAPKDLPGAGGNTGLGNRTAVLGDVTAKALGQEFVDACTQEKLQLLDGVIAHINELKAKLTEKKEEDTE